MDRARFVALAGSVWLSLGCTQSREPAGPLPAVCPQTTDDIQRTILAPSCGSSGCHSGSLPAADLDLVAPGVESRLLGRRAVMCFGEVLLRPGDPEGSFFYRKLVDEMPACGERMPARTDPLVQGKIDCLRQWIERLGGGGMDGGTLPDGGVVDTGPGGEDAGTSDAGRCSPLAECSGACTDTSVDPANCGGCGTACAAGQACATGACTCAGGLLGCGPLCVDSSADPNNCGGCGVVCSTGQSCTGGTCVCSGGLTPCGGSCIDTLSNAAHCGGCDSPCAAGTVCSAGSCVGGGCPFGTTDCGGSCVDTDTSASNCGTCGTTCGAGQACVGGSCVCTGGLVLCSGACVDTSSSSTNCGACGRTCLAGQTCTAGTCACSSGLTECSGTCVSTATDPINCGSCGTRCPAGSTCTASRCTCPSGQMLCGGACIDTTSDPANCGGCGVTCPSGAVCSGSTCTSCGPPSTLSGQVQPIFTMRCGGTTCHQGMRPAGDLSLEPGRTYAALVGVPANGCMDGRLRVAPGSPATSYLVNKLTGVGMCSGRQMPLMSTPLPATQIDLIRSWICRGAMND